MSIRQVNGFGDSGMSKPSSSTEASEAMGGQQRVPPTDGWKEIFS